MPCERDADIAVDVLASRPLLHGRRLRQDTADGGPESRAGRDQLCFMTHTSRVVVPEAVVAVTTRQCCSQALAESASQDKVLGLEAEVAALQDRLRALELERAQHRVQLEAFSQHVTSHNDSADLGFSPDAGGRAEV